MGMYWKTTGRIHNASTLSHCPEPLVSTTTVSCDDDNRPKIRFHGIVVDSIDDDSLQSGVFYGSKAPVLVGPLVDQGTIFADLNNRTFQDNASEAIHTVSRAGRR